MNEDAIDRFTLAHVVVGYAMRRWGFGWRETLVVAITWEAIEPLLKESYPDMFPHPTRDTERNKAVDVIATVVGWSLGN